MIAWSAVWTLARHEWRHRWRALVLLGVAGGIVAGTALAIATVLWRTDTAYDRLVDATNLDDVRVSIMTTSAVPSDRAAILAEQRRTTAALIRNPAVVETQEITTQVGRIRGPGVVYASVYAPQHPFDGFAEPVVVDGRAPHDDSVNEVMLEESRAREGQFSVGDVVSMDLLTPKQYQDFSRGIGRPRGGHVELQLVGIFRYPRPRFGFDSFLATPAFHARYEADSVGVLELLGTRGHVGPGSGTGSIAQAAQALETSLQTKYGSAKQAFVTVDEPRRSPDPAIGSTLAVLRSGLLALVAVVALAGFILAGQLAGRWAERGRASQEIEKALGLRTSERALGRFFAAVPTVVLTAALAATGSLVGGVPEPLGSLGKYEPSPGWLPHPSIAAWGTVLVTAILLAVLVGTTLRAGRPRRLPARRKRRWWGRAPLRRVPLLAVSLSSGRGGPRTSVPARSMVVGLAAMLAALVVVGEVYDQLSDLRAQPARWGWTADFGVVDDTAQLDRQLLVDPRVRDLEQLTDSPVVVRRPDGTDLRVTGFGRATLRGSLPWTLGAGRLPIREDEVALGPRSLHDLDVAVGDEVSFVAHRALVPMRVVGVALIPNTGDGTLGRDALFTQGGMRRAAGATGFSSVLIRAVDPVAAAALHSELVRQYELSESDPPPAISAIDELGTPTRVLLLVLLLAAMLLISQNTRLLLRRRGSQLAVVDAMGMPRRELIGAAALSLLWTSLLAAVVGLPFGWAVSRIVLAEVGPRLGLILQGPGEVAAVLAGAAAMVLTAVVAVSATSFALGRRRRQALVVDG